MDHPISTTLSLFSGIGGLDIGWSLATGSRVVGYCERDSYAAHILLARMEEQALEPAPVWCGGVADMPLAPFHGVDALIGGFPCQDISAAGKGAGIGGERSGLWGRAFVPAIRELRPRYVFLENVAALRTRGLDTVLADLAALGFDAEWTCLRAADVGAPHQRERIFILAHASGTRSQGRGPAHPGGRGESPAALFPPRPGNVSAWREVVESAPHLAPAVKPGFRLLADGAALVVDASRADQLRCVGNGVVPLQAAVAARLLLQCLSCTQEQ